MDYRQIEHFVAVAERLSFSRAAESLHLAASQVSRSVRQLEDYLGVQLLTRGPHHVALTSAGEQFYPAARRVVSAFHDAQIAGRALGFRAVRIGSRAVSESVKTRPPDVLVYVAVEVVYMKTYDQMDALARG